MNLLLQSVFYTADTSKSMLMRSVVKMKLWAVQAKQIKMDAGLSWVPMAFYPLEIRKNET